MNWQKSLTGMIGHDELLNILHALALTDCDQRTLQIVACATGLSEHFQPASPRVTVELPIKLLPGEVTK